MTEYELAKATAQYKDQILFINNKLTKVIPVDRLLQTDAWQICKSRDKNRFRQQKNKAFMR